jgi:hypothetical protein
VAAALVRVPQQKAAAREAGEAVGGLLALAGTDAVLRAQVGDMIRAAGKGALPDAATVARRIGLGLSPGQPGMTVAEWLRAWLASRRTIRPSTLRSYRQHVNTWLIPHLGHLQLERLTAAHISAMFAAIDRASADLDAGVLVVDHTILELDGHLTEGVPKTRAGVRRVYLDEETAGLLRAHRKGQLAARLRAGDEWVGHDLIFTRFDGTPWRPSYVSRRFRQLAAQAGVPVITLHEGGRHTGVSLMHDAEVRDDIAMPEAGHSDRAVHAAYNHPLDEAHRQAAEQVAALVRRAGGGR